MKKLVILIISDYITKSKCNLIKDKENLLDFNLWSGGEYNNNTNGLDYNSNEIQIEISEEFKSNGDKSFKIIHSDPSSSYVLTSFVVSTSEYIGKTATFTAKILNLMVNDNIRLVISNKITANTVFVPYSEEATHVTLTHTIASDRLVIYLSFKINQVGSYFIDDLQLNIQ